jgi:hypothetical protein
MNMFGLDSDGIERKAEQRYSQSLWYAWGRMDAGEGQGILTLEDGNKFADAQKIAARTFYSEGAHVLESILGAWAKYVESRGVTPVRS